MDEETTSRRLAYVTAIAVVMASSFLCQRWRRSSVTATPPRSLDQSRLTGQTPGTTKNAERKTVYLIRHAESLENERSASLQRSASNLIRLRLPTRLDIEKASELFDIQSQVDSDVSDVGRDQIENVARQLEGDNFLARREVRLVVHSPLKRARQTCAGMLGCVAAPTVVGAEGKQVEWASKWGGYNIHTDDSSCSAPSAEESSSNYSEVSEKCQLTAPVGRVDELPCLLEKAAAEWIPGNSGAFEARIASFEVWLSDQPERAVAVVGHSQFFRAMLGLDYLFGNCDVWEVTWDGHWQEGLSSQKSGACSHTGGVSTDAEEEEKDTEDVSGTDCTSIDLPRGWSNLQRLYSYERKGTKMEKEDLS